MFRLVLHPFGKARRRLVVSLAVGLLLLLVVAAPLGLHYWALSHYQAAAQALDDDCPEEAHDHIAVCLTVWPYSAATHLLAARIARLAGDYPQAEVQLGECNRLQKEPGLETHLEALLVRAEQGEVDDLERDLVLTSNRDEAQARPILEALGRGKLNLFNYLPALYYFSRCLDRYPNDVHALAGRGLTLERMKERDKAKADYRRALELSHGRADVRLRLATLCLEDSEVAEAESHLELLRKAHPGRLDVEAAWARLKFLQGKTEECRRLADALLAAHPDDFGTLYLRGQLALADGRPAEAEGCLRRALKVDRSNPAVYCALFDSLRAQPGREADAQAVLKESDRAKADSERLAQLLTESPQKSQDDADVLAEVGELCLRLDRAPMGVYWLTAALKKDPNCQRAHQALAAYYEEKGDTAEAERHRRPAE